MICIMLKIISHTISSTYIMHWKTLNCVNLGLAYFALLYLVLIFS